MDRLCVLKEILKENGFHVIEGEGHITVSFRDREISMKTKNPYAFCTEFGAEIRKNRDIMGRDAAPWLQVMEKLGNALEKYDLGYYGTDIEERRADPNYKDDLDKLRKTVLKHGFKIDEDVDSFRISKKDRDVTVTKDGWSLMVLDITEKISGLETDETMIYSDWHDWNELLKDIQG